MLATADAHADLARRLLRQLAHRGVALDTYPYIFLDLMLSTPAAIQVPVIMMSHNRQVPKDRLAALEAKIDGLARDRPAS